MIRLRYFSRLALALLAIGGTTPVLAGNSTSEATVTTVRPATLVKVDDLDFGTVASGSTAGTVSVNVATGIRTATGGVTLAGGAPQRAEFEGASSAGLLGGLWMSVNAPSAVTLSRTGGGASDLNATLNWSMNGTGIPLLGVYLLNSPTQTFRAGGTLTIPANQPGGAYEGTFRLTVNYN